MKPFSTLFLDRDGVINTELPADYVKTISEFQFETGVFEAILLLQRFFNRIIIITNQRGVGAGIMSQADLDLVHSYMLKEFSKHGIEIDAIYAATDVDRSSEKRKPRPYMGYLAKTDFPEIDFSRSLMIGNSVSDLEFGKSLHMKTAFVDDKKKHTGTSLLPLADAEGDSLLEIALKFEAEIQPLFTY
ncbi:MAG: HAD-IIIA family hydrolase [Bacteroidia bacterium]